MSLLTDGLRVSNSSRIVCTAASSLANRESSSLSDSLNSRLVFNPRAGCRSPDVEPGVFSDKELTENLSAPGGLVRSCWLFADMSVLSSSRRASAEFCGVEPLLSGEGVAKLQDDRMVKAKPVKIKVHIFLCSLRELESPGAFERTMMKIFKTRISTEL